MSWRGWAATSSSSLLIDPPKDMAAISETMHRIRAAIAEPVELEGRSFRITSSFGAGDLSQSTATSVETLLANADAAMYRAKEFGRRQSRQSTRRRSTRSCSSE